MPKLIKIYVYDWRQHGSMCEPCIEPTGAAFRILEVWNGEFQTQDLCTECYQEWFDYWKQGGETSNITYLGEDYG